MSGQDIDKKTIHGWIKNIVKYQDDFYYIQREFPLLFKINMINNTLEVEADFSDIISESPKYSHIIRFASSLFLIPDKATNYIIRYDLDSKIITKIPFSIDDLGGYTDGEYVLYNDNIVILGQQGIIIVNAITNEVKVIKSWYEKIQPYIKNETVFSVFAGCIVKDELVFGCFQADILIAVNINTQDVKIVEINSGIEGFSSIAYDGEFYYLLSTLGGTILKMTPSFKIVDKIDLLEADEQIWRNKRDFLKLVIFQNRLILFPWEGSSVLELDKVNFSRKEILKISHDRYACTTASVYEDELLSALNEGDGIVLFYGNSHGYNKYQIKKNKDVDKKIVEKLYDKVVFMEKDISAHGFIESILE